MYKLYLAASSLERFQDLRSKYPSKRKNHNRLTHRWNSCLEGANRWVIVLIGFLNWYRSISFKIEAKKAFQDGWNGETKDRLSDDVDVSIDGLPVHPTEDP